MRQFFPLAPFNDQPTNPGQRDRDRPYASPQNLTPPTSRPDRWGVYSVGGAVSPPILMYSEPAVYPEYIGEMETPGTVLVTAILGADGVPAGADVLVPLMRPLNHAAVKATNLLRFEPATFNGRPVPVRIFVEFTFPKGDGVAHPTIVQRGNPMEPPVALNSIWVAYPRSARKRRIKGTVVISFVVTREGQPTDLHLIRSVAKDLNESAMRAVRRLRFKPAAMNGKPVPAHVTIDVNFVLYM